jgi:hypothetical protein
VNVLLAEAARFERDWRAERYPPKIAAGETSAEDAAIDFQCWVAIAEWLETDRFTGFHGGAEPDTSDAPWISWPELVCAADKAIDTAAAKVTRLEAKHGQGAPELAETYRRRANLVCIQRALHLRRESIDAINAEIRATRQQVAA